jgi:hydroxymethylbilane synthase
MMNNLLRVGSRGSELALWQAHWVRDRLQALHRNLTVEVEIIKTAGDRVLDAPLSKIGDKGLFTREIEHALLEGAIDLAVHSLKDLPTELPEGLILGAVTEREDVRDVFIPRPGNTVRSLSDLPRGGAVATGSLRRKCQLLRMRPDLRIVDIRGNLSTRYAKLAGSEWEGMVLARAGVVRLGWTDRMGETIDPLLLLPAVGQGALGIEVRADTARVLRYVEGLHHPRSAAATTAERALLHALEGGCQVPIGTYGRIESDSGGQLVLVLDALVGSLDGTRVVRDSLSGPPEQAADMGARLAHRLLAQGAQSILDEIRSQAPT